MNTVTALRLPGVTFLPSLRPAAPVLPPLDVAAFVGFAQRGPLDTPVPLDDYADYRAIFGGELMLARERNGDTLSAHMPAAVAAFFSNGGRRCYVVRIAGEQAQRARWQMAGITRINPFGLTASAETEAASAGRWPESLHLAARLQTKYLPVSAFSTFQRETEGFTLLWDTGGVAETLLPGDVLRIATPDTPADTVWFFVVGAVSPVTNGTLAMRQLVAASLWQVRTGFVAQRMETAPASATLTRSERMRFNLVLREAGQPQQTLTDLAFNAPHPRFWGDVALLESSPLFKTNAKQAGLALSAAERYRAAQQETRAFRVAEIEPGKVELSGRLAPLSEIERANVYLPLNLPEILSDTDFAAPTVAGEDDLTTFPAHRFLDAYLTQGGSDATRLRQSAEDRVWIQERRLRGLHSLMFVDEVGLVALPDVVHPGWKIEAPPPAEPSPPVPTPPPPDRSLFDICITEAAEATTPPTTTTTVKERLLPVVQEENLDGSGDPEAVLRDSPLVRVQAELQKFCEARRDVIGILTLPISYERRRCRMWQRALRQRLALPPEPSVFNETEDLPDLSYVAVYHPWMQIADTTAANRLRAVPPDGAVCGMIAARERARGVWVAPANVPLDGVLGLIPRISEDDRADLFAVGFNILHAEPRDFRAMSAHTLSDERIWLQISVRRLMIQLRKMLLLRGDEMVFENNSPLFREAVRISLDGALQILFRGGAFAGRTAEQSYRINVGPDINTPESVDRGLFIAEIQVAPSQPGEFITVQLVRTDDNLLTTREG